MDQAPSKGHEASPQSGLGVGLLGQWWGYHVYHELRGHVDPAETLHSGQALQLGVTRQKSRRPCRRRFINRGNQAWRAPRMPP